MQLSEKDLLYLSDEAHWELLAAKKSYDYANEASQPEAAQLLHRIGQMHQHHCQQILDTIQKSASSASMNQQPSPFAPTHQHNNILN